MPAPGTNRNDQQLLQVMSTRVVYYRLAMVRVMSVLRPKACLGCRQAEALLLDADVDRPNS